MGLHGSLNKKTMFDAYPMLLIHEILESFHGFAVFFMLDLLSVYWQIAMERQHWELTAFTTPHGLFKFCVLIFGLKNAALCFISSILEEIQKQCYQLYIGIIVYSPDLQHLCDLKQMFQQLQKAKPTFNL